MLTRKIADRVIEIHMTENYLIYGVTIFLFISNGVTIFILVKEKKKRQKNSQQSFELSEFLADLLQGEGLVKVTRIAPNDIFLRSPRGR